MACLHYRFTSKIGELLCVCICVCTVCVDVHVCLWKHVPVRTQVSVLIILCITVCIATHKPALCALLTNTSSRFCWARHTPVTLRGNRQPSGRRNWLRIRTSWKQNSHTWYIFLNVARFRDKTCKQVCYIKDLKENRDQILVFTK